MRVMLFGWPWVATSWTRLRCSDTLSKVDGPLVTKMADVTNLLLSISGPICCSTEDRNSRRGRNGGGRSRCWGDVSGVTKATCSGGCSTAHEFQRKRALPLKLCSADGNVLSNSPPWLEPCRSDQHDVRLEKKSPRR